MQDRFKAVRERINCAAKEVGRPVNAVRLIAVSKTQPTSAIRAAYALGQRDFGENYLQEALDKQAELLDLGDIIWHFIGPIQSNKTRSIAEHFSWVHTVDRVKIAERLNQQRPLHLPPLNVCIQVNVSGESSKSGVNFQELPEFADAIETFERLRYRGLMTIPAPLASSDNDPERPFRRLREAAEQLPQPFDSLSMGMSDDLEYAIHQGATWVRIGTALFGPRCP